jgi:hypothetical protein
VTVSTHVLADVRGVYRLILDTDRPLARIGGLTRIADTP